MAIPLPPDTRELLDAPNYVHLSTLRADGSPRNWAVWVGLEDDHILVCTSDAIAKARDMRRDPRVALSLTEAPTPTAWQRSRAGSWRYVGRGLPLYGPDLDQVHQRAIPEPRADRVCFVIAVEKAAQNTLGFPHNPG